MSVLARGPPVCLSCRTKQAVLTRRRLSHAAKRSLETIQVVVHTEHNALPTDNTHSQSTPSATSPGPDLEHVGPRVRLQVSVDGLREATLSFEALVKSRDARVKRLRGLSNPGPEPPRGRQYIVPKERNFLAVRNDSLLSHDDFKRELREAMGEKALRSVLRRQLLRCELPRDIFKIVAVALQAEKTATNLVQLFEPLMRALYRCRQKVTDPEVLSTLNTVISRFKAAGLPVSCHLYNMALKFAARSRSLPSMKKYLKIIHDTGQGMNSHLFRSVIAKCSIGHRGLGEIRNGRWRRSELRQVLLGFDDTKHLPEDQQFHFGTYLKRDDWQFLHGWVAVLARCKESDEVWREWESWKQSEAFQRPRELLRTTNRHGLVMTNKLRGSYWFLEQIVLSGDLARAWRLFEETGISFSTLKTSIKDRLLDAPEYATSWNNEICTEMVKKYDRDLSRIEQALGVKWVTGENDGDGQHVLFRDQEEALDELGCDSWQLKENYGYPWGETEALADHERDLHDAEEDRSL